MSSRRRTPAAAGLDNVVTFPATPRARKAQRRDVRAEALRIAAEEGWKPLCKQGQTLHALFYGTSFDGRRIVLDVAERIRATMPYYADRDTD